VECYIEQVKVDVPAVKPNPGACKLPATPVKNTYLQNYPLSLGSGGVYPPAVWPYNTSSLADAGSWCCAAGHEDCVGVSFQNGRYEAWAGTFPVPNPSGSCTCNSYPRPHAQGGLNTINLTKCVVTAELDFTQAGSGGDGSGSGGGGVGGGGGGIRSSNYIDVPTRSKTLELSERLTAYYSKYFL